MSGFLQVTICMYLSFKSLRKECLNGVVNMAAVCSVSEDTSLVKIDFHKKKNRTNISNI